MCVFVWYKWEMGKKTWFHIKIKRKEHYAKSTQTNKQNKLSNKEMYIIYERQNHRDVNLSKHVLIYAQVVNLKSWT